MQDRRAIAHPGAASPRRILIIKPSSLGDIVHALPVLVLLRETWPQACIAWLAGTAFAPLLDGHPLLDEVIVFDRRRFGRLLQSRRILADFVCFVWRLRRRRFDLVIDLQGLVRSGFLAWASGARRRIGFAEARELAPLFYSQRVACPPDATHAVDKNWHLAGALVRRDGASGGPSGDREGAVRDHPDPRWKPDTGARPPPRFPLGLRSGELAAARRLLAEAAGRPLDTFIALLPGARWESKRWPADRFATLIGRLHAEGLPPVVLLGGPDDRTLAEQIASACAAPVTNLVGRSTLRELSALLALSTLVICQDSGPMHIAAALDKPLVALFGPTSPARTGPYSPAARVISLPLECAPCYRRQCPLGHHACLKRLEIDAVLAAVRERWNTADRSAPVASALV
ncbi:MAG: lipopolysaccharide heptosyltransferase II [Planctomycetota bacterium]